MDAKNEKENLFSKMRKSFNKTRIKFFVDVATKELSYVGIEDPDRRLAVKILEYLAARLGKEKVFDSDWYGYEDLVTRLIKERK